MTKLNIDEATVEYDADDPEGFKSGRIPFRRLLGATKTGVSVYDLPPGQAICPYHYEYAEEEWLLVLTGTPLLRTPSGESRLREHDVCFFPTGPAGAHKITNDTADPVRVLMFSDVLWPAATVYPDSDKIGVYVGNDTDTAMFRRESAVDYFDRET